MKIAVDAMGGDNAPEVVVQGAVQAASELGIHVILIGDKELIAGALGSQVYSDHIAVHHC
jgi:glycerol-3-phosphate acyltransferase PlsX